MNPRTVDKLLVELTDDMRAVEATTTKQGQNIIAEALTAADGLKLVREDAKLLTGRVTDAIKVGRERHDENKATFAEIQDWRKLTDEDLDTINERLDLRTAHFQTQIDCCQVKRPIRDVLWALFAAFVLGYIFAPGISQLF